jgi:ribosome-associated protein
MKMKTKLEITTELKFKTSRSGGKGGQNVNKVETKVDARWHVQNSVLVTEQQKILIIEKLQNKINESGELVVTCTEDRTQLGNKEKAIKKINDIVRKALIVPIKRKPTQIPKGVVEKRLNDKKVKSEIKESRKKVDE